jgi:hypothetical protein
MSTINFGCSIAPTNAAAAIGLEIWIDDQKLFDQAHVQEHHKISTDLSDDDGDHELRFVLKNKLPEHTRVDADNNIVSDARISVSNIEFDGIALNQLVPALAEYQHNFNGTGDQIIDEFYGEMGCNGTVTLKFTTPIYLWLLEHM